MNCFKDLLCEVCNEGKNYGNAEIQCDKCEKDFEEILENEYIEDILREEAELEEEVSFGVYYFD